MLFAIVLYIFEAWGEFKILQKIDYEDAWHAFVPALNQYALFKLSWNTKMFWYYFLIYLFGEFICAFFVTGIINLLGNIIILIAVIISMMQHYRLAKAFGYDILFAIGLYLLRPIFMIILGYDQSKYLGPQN